MEVAGVAYESQNTYYRHFLADKSHTIRVRLDRLSGKGYPKLMVKLSNERILPNSNEPTSFDAKVELMEGKNSV